MCTVSCASFAHHILEHVGRAHFVMSGRSAQSSGSI
jgi:hypothetical protein